MWSKKKCEALQHHCPKGEHFLRANLTIFPYRSSRTTLSTRSQLYLIINGSVKNRPHSLDLDRAFESGIHCPWSFFLTETEMEVKEAISIASALSIKTSCSQKIIMVARSDGQEVEYQ